MIYRCNLCGTEMYWSGYGASPHKCGLAKSTHEKIVDLSSQIRKLEYERRSLWRELDSQMKPKTFKDYISDNSPILVADQSPLVAGNPELHRVPKTRIKTNDEGV